jgi:hypothetical protein
MGSKKYEIKDAERGREKSIGRLVNIVLVKRSG